MKNKIITIMIFSLIFECCVNNERDFFNNIKDKVVFDSENFWEIKPKTKVKVKGVSFFKTEIQIFSFYFDGYSYFYNNALYLNESKSMENAIKLFDFGIVEKDRYVWDNGTKIKLLAIIDNVYFFSIVENVIFNDMGYSNTTVWAVSKDYGILTVVNIDEFNCEYLLKTGNVSVIDDNINTICNRLRGQVPKGTKRVKNGKYRGSN